MRDIQKLTDILVDELPDKHPWEGEICKLVDRLIANCVTVRERGRWIPHYETFDEDAALGILGGTYQTGWQCSVCGRYEPGKEPYCNCGADMRGEEDA